MLNLGNLHVSNFTIAMLVVWLLVSYINKQAVFMFCALLIYTAVNAITDTNFSGFLITSVLFFTASSSNIKVSLQIRKAFIAFGVVYFIGAIDQAVYYHIDIDTSFDRIQPYLVTTINACILASLLSDGGREGATTNGMRTTSFCRRWFGLSLRQESDKDYQKRG